MNIKLQDNSLNKLKEITANLFNFPDLLANWNRKDHVQELKMAQGTGFGWNILFIPGILSVDKWFLSKDSVFEKHVHEEKEWIIVYSGNLHVIHTKENKEFLLHKGESCYNNILQEHLVYTSEDTWCLTVTIPPAQGFPWELLQKENNE